MKTIVNKIINFFSFKLEKPFSASFKLSAVVALLVVLAKFPLEYFMFGETAFILYVIIALISFILTFLFSYVINTSNSTIEIAKKNLDAIKKFEKNIVDSMKSIRIQTHMNEISKFVDKTKETTILKPLLNDIIEDHIYQITTDMQKSVFNIDGHASSILSYEIFWKRILKEQNRRKKLKEKALVLRITHSNNVDMWDPRGNSNIHEILEYHLNFKKAGGFLVRFFIFNMNIKKEKDSELLDEIIKIHRNDYQIPTWKVAVKHDPFKYDFMLLEDERLILKWYSTSSGDKIANMELSENFPPRDTTRENWGILWERLIIQEIENGNTEIKNQLDEAIPSDRQIDYDSDD